MTEQFVVKHSEFPTLIGPFPTRDAAWAWVDALPVYEHVTEAGVELVRMPG